MSDFVEPSAKSFIESCSYVHHTNGESIITALTPEQQVLLLSLENCRWTEMALPRQKGTTMLLGLYALWHALHKPDRRVVYVSNKQAAAYSVNERVRYSHRKLTFPYNDPLTVEKKRELQFTSGGSIYFWGPNPCNFRGLAVNLIICDNTVYAKRTAEEMRNEMLFQFGSCDARVAIVSTVE